MLFSSGYFYLSAAIRKDTFILTTQPFDSVINDLITHMGYLAVIYVEAYSALLTLDGFVPYTRVIIICCVPFARQAF